MRKMLNNFDIAQRIDHTCLRPDATTSDIDRICKEAQGNEMRGVCVNPVYVMRAVSQLTSSQIEVVAVVGFPLGANTRHVKEKEACAAVADGATEVDAVINIGYFKNGDYNYVLDELKRIVNVVAPRWVKSIIETCYLTKDEIVIASKISLDAGCSFVKTSTGLGAGGATLEDIKLIRDTVRNKCGIKASGGIKSLSSATLCIEAGADVLGTSATMKILGEVRDLA
ncbi:MAG: deoxyribose-phosphate aldolase [Peptococcaceae bacterium]|jgi:deoxyribose-phosphate aldolase|nr:deoxyribose-phosphate aldolase [Peptococcaceae bacterium]